MEKLLEQLGSYGVLGIIVAYFLYNDHQDRKVHRAALQSLFDQVSNLSAQLKKHERRIIQLEESKRY